MPPYDEAGAMPAPIGDNKPPLPEVAKLDIENQLAPLKPRLDELLGAFGRAKCDTAENAGKCADLVKQLKALKTKVERVRGDVGEPYREATAVINATTKQQFTSLIDEAETKLRGMLNTFAREAEAKRRREEAEQAQRDAAERARLAELDRPAREAAAAAGASVPEPEPEPEPEPLRREAPKPVAAGDYGASAHRTVRKVPVIVDVYALPAAVLNSPDVVEAIKKVVKRLRSANPDEPIEGIRWEDDISVQVR